jgi:CRISPR/Cas system-associated exonuclease Cas4 (RecB family)
MSINISASLIRDYLSCPTKVFYRINHPETSIQSKEMLLGEIVHKAIETSWDFPELAKEYVTRLSRSKLPGDWDSELFATTCIKNYWEIFRGMLSENDQIEKFFKIEFSEGVYIVGKMDRVTSDGLVIDWKTNRKTPKSITYDPQFILYHWAYTKLFNKQPKGVYYASLTDGSILRLSPDTPHYKSLFEDLIPSIISDIKNQNLPKTGIFTGACYRCPYKEACLQEEKNVVVSSDIIKE